jgi:hypothetical protein
MMKNALMLGLILLVSGITWIIAFALAYDPCPCSYTQVMPQLQFNIPSNIGVILIVLGGCIVAGNLIKGQSGEG